MCEILVLVSNNNNNNNNNNDNNYTNFIKKNIIILTYNQNIIKLNIKIIIKLIMILLIRLIVIRIICILLGITHLFLHNVLVHLPYIAVVTNTWAD